MKKLALLATAVVASAVVMNPVLATSVIDATELATAETNMIDTITDIGGMLIAVGIVAVAFKWAKGALFG